MSNEHPNTLLGRYIPEVVSNALHLEQVLRRMQTLAPHGTWLGSRKLGPDTAEYQFSAAASKKPALHGIGAKTGGGYGIMEAPIRGCLEAGRPELGIGVRLARLKTEEEPNPYLEHGAHVFDMNTFHSRHDALFHGALFYVVCWGRLGTVHEKYDLLNQLKHGFLGAVPIYFVEKDGYHSDEFEFMTGHVNKVLGPRVSAEDVEGLRFINLSETSGDQFADLVLQDIRPLVAPKLVTV